MADHHQYGGIRNIPQVPSVAAVCGSIHTEIAVRRRPPTSSRACIIGLSWLMHRRRRGSTVVWLHLGRVEFIASAGIIALFTVGIIGFVLDRMIVVPHAVKLGIEDHGLSELDRQRSSPRFNPERVLKDINLTVEERLRLDRDHSVCGKSAQRCRMTNATRRAARNCNSPDQRVGLPEPFAAVADDLTMFAWAR